MFVLEEGGEVKGHRCIWGGGLMGSEGSAERERGGEGELMDEDERK